MSTHPSLRGQQGSVSSAPPGQGGNGYTLTIAGLDVCVRAADGLELRTPHGSFLSSQTSSDLEIDTRWGELGGDSPGELLFDAGSPWRLYGTRDGFAVTFHAAGRDGIPYKLARVNDDFTRCEVVLHRPYFDPDEAVDPLEYPLDELLVVQRLGQELGVELHSCGIVDEDGSGLVFCGQSGDGKTTLARLWTSSTAATVLSDDRTIVRPEDGGFTMFGTPWHGEGAFAVNDSTRLSAIFILEQAGGNRAIRMPVAEATSALMARTFTTFFDRHSTAWILGLLESIARSVPCFRLEFRPEPGAIAVARAAARELLQ